MQDHKQFGKASRQLPGLQFKLADMATELVAARQMAALARQQTRRRAREPPPTAPCEALCHRCAGFTVVNEAPATARRLPGYPQNTPLERLLRDAACVHQILEINEIMRVIIARRMLDGDAPEAIR